MSACPLPVGAGDVRGAGGAGGAEIAGGDCITYIWKNKIHKLLWGGNYRRKKEEEKIAQEKSKNP